MLGYYMQYAYYMPTFAPFVLMGVEQFLTLYTVIALVRSAERLQNSPQKCQKVVPLRKIALFLHSSTMKKYGSLVCTLVCTFTLER